MTQTQEDFLDEIMSAIEGEPELDYGDPRMNERIRMEGIRNRIYDLIEAREKEIEQEEGETLSDELEAAEDEIIRLKRKLSKNGIEADDD